MNSVIKFGLRPCLAKLSNPTKLLTKTGIHNRTLTPAYSRTLFHMCSTSKINGDFLKPKALSECCQCGCSGLLHTGGEKDLVEFLQTEIQEEKKAMKMTSLPSELHGFTIASEKAELKFTKKTQLETITVSMNVTDSVDTDNTIDGEGLENKLRSRPSFDVDIVRHNKTLNFSCSFVEFDEEDDQEAGDLFQINEITYFEGEWDDKVYSVAADILDENLYDLFMVVLNEKGINRTFVEKMSDIATYLEQSQYIGLLENVRKFASVN